MKNRLCFITRSDLRKNPYPEIALPALARAGWDITIFAPGAERSVLRSIRPYPCKPSNLSKQNQSPLALREMEIFKTLLKARFGPYDVIYIHSQSLSSRAVIACLGPMLGKRVVYHNPDFYDPFHHPLYFTLEKTLCRKADLYMNNEFHRGYITQTMYRLRCPVVTAPPNLPSYWPIPEPSRERRFEMCRSENNGPFILMLHGGYSELRMVPQLLKALSILPSGFHLVMTNIEHRKQEADRLLRDLNLFDRVTRLPHLTFRELFEYTVNADAGVLFYNNNDLGNFFTSPGRLTEYLACGLPVIATNHTGLENLVFRYGLGESVDSKDPGTIAAGILALEKGVREGNFKREKMKHVFFKHFCFDHWEKWIVKAFDDMFSVQAFSPSLPPKYPWIPSH